MTKTDSSNNNAFRSLTWWEIQALERNRCTAAEWSRVLVTDATDLSLIRDVDFEGEVRIGRLDAADVAEGAPRPLVSRARIADSTIGDNVRIVNIGREIRGATIGDRVTIENMAAVVFEPGAEPGYGVQAAVLDETGSRPVALYPGLSAQVAMLMAFKPRWAEEVAFPQVAEMSERQPLAAKIDDDASVRDCGILINVYVGREVRVEGARRLVNGAVVNNAAAGRALAYVGAGVDAENFLIVDGVADCGSILRNSFVGQGAVIDKGATAHDSLLFANTTIENGEAVALFAAPYTVSMHKATLLIGAMTSFMNAGSATNQSNHMYKLGPVHWGVLERGVKTSSNSYMMWGGKIGAFSLLMGAHKNHPDSSEFPFSYLFGDDKGATSVVPGMMLRSCGLLRDEKKWPTRDRRLKRRLPMHDRINFEVLNPATVGRILDTLPVMRELLQKPLDDDRFLRYKGMKFRAAHIERAMIIYRQAICKYLEEKIGDGPFPDSPAEHDEEPEKWVDIAGQLMPQSYLDRALAAETLLEAEAVFDEAAASYEDLERAWIGERLGEWRGRREEYRIGARDFDEQVEDDRVRYREGLSAENAMNAL